MQRPRTPSHMYYYVYVHLASNKDHNGSKNVALSSPHCWPWELHVGQVVLAYEPPARDGDIGERSSMTQARVVQMPKAILYGTANANRSAHAHGQKEATWSEGGNMHCLVSTFAVNVDAFLLRIADPGQWSPRERMNAGRLAIFHLTNHKPSGQSRSLPSLI